MRRRLSLRVLHVFVSCRGGAGGGVADGGGVVLPGPGLFVAGGATSSGGGAVHVDTATGRHGEEEAGQLQRDAAEKKQAANQRRA